MARSSLLLAVAVAAVAVVPVALLVELMVPAVTAKGQVMLTEHLVQEVPVAPVESR